MDFTLFVTLIVINLGLAVAIGVILGKTGLLDRDDNRLPPVFKEIASALVFGLMAVVGTYSYSTAGVLYNSRNGAVISGGLYFGPIAALGSAIIAILYRSTWGGATMFPCLLATAIAAFVLIVIYDRWGGRITLLKAMAITIPIEVLHLALVVLFIPDGQGWDLIVNNASGLVILMSTLVVGAFGISYNWSKRK